VSASAILCLIFALRSEQMFGASQVIFTSLFFIPIAYGNTLFGLLKQNASILLGEISYSIYLLHGLVLYFLFSVMNVINIGALNFSMYVLMLSLVGVIVIAFSTVTFLLIEKP